MSEINNYKMQFEHHIHRKKRMLLELERIERCLKDLELATKQMTTFMENATNIEDVKWSKRQIKDFREEYEEEKTLYRYTTEQLHAWDIQYRAIHLSMIWDLEKADIPIHTIQLPCGPTHPNSYLLYKDGSNLIFLRDQSNKYSSYRFWLELQSVKEPIQTLGTTYYSAKELNVEPYMIEILYVLENQYLNGDHSVKDNILKIRAELESKI